MYMFLLIGEPTQTLWNLALHEALSTLGKLSIVCEAEALTAVIQSYYDVIIIDASIVPYPARLITLLFAQRPGARVIVATASPTWTRARDALQAGAADYIDKSLNREELRNKVQAVLDVPTSTR